MERSGGEAAEGAAARWARLRGSQAAGPTLRAMAAAGLARYHHALADPNTADHW